MYGNIVSQATRQQTFFVFRHVKGAWDFRSGTVTHRHPDEMVDK